VRKLAVLLLLALGTRSTPPPSRLLPFDVTAAHWLIDATSGTIKKQGPWSYTFPLCPNPQACHTGYIAAAVNADISAANSITLSYVITGDQPVFDYRTNPNNTCGPGKPGALSLYIQRQGDDMSAMGVMAYYRWFAVPERVDLALGSVTLTVSLKDVSKWVSVYSSDPAVNASYWQPALASVGNIGFVLGGGCFAGHGVALTSGSATFTLKSYVVQ
jgi:hypothetical protein